MSEDIYDYIYVSQGKTKVDSIDDNEELEYTEDAFNVLGFGADEKFDCYMLTAAVMTCGGVEFKTKGRDDQAECEAIGTSTTSINSQLTAIYFKAQTLSLGKWPEPCRWTPST